MRFVKLLPGWGLYPPPPNPEEGWANIVGHFPCNGFLRRWGVGWNWERATYQHTEGILATNHAGLCDTHSGSLEHHEGRRSHQHGGVTTIDAAYPATGCVVLDGEGNVHHRNKD